jgi:hypothetical protein
VTDRESWQADAPEPLITIRAGGKLEGIVTLTAIAYGHGRTLVEAFWTQDGHARSDSIEVESYQDAREIANTAADELAAGIAPDFTRD